MYRARQYNTNVRVYLQHVGGIARGFLVVTYVQLYVQLYVLFVSYATYMHNCMCYLLTILFSQLNWKRFLDSR